MDMMEAASDAGAPTPPAQGHARELPEDELELDDGREEKVVAATVASAPARSSNSPFPKKSEPKAKRVKPIIDLDDHISKAQEATKMARKQVQQARAQAKLEKRKKQRLLRKASTLNVEDLERIAVLKRCGLIHELCNASAGSGHAASSDAASGEAPACSKQARPRSE